MVIGRSRSLRFTLRDRNPYSPESFYRVRCLHESYAGSPGVWSTT